MATPSSSAPTCTSAASKQTPPERIIDQEIPIPDKSATVVCGRRLFALAVAGAAFNLLAFPVLRVLQIDRGAMMLVAPLVFGCLLGQIGAMALWLVWGDGSFLWRLAIHWSISLALITCALIGFAFASAAAPNNGPFIADEVLRVFCLLPSISLAIQAVHWPRRTHFRWRVESQTKGERGLQSTPLSILDMLAGMTVVAISLALIRLAHFQFWIEAAITALCVAAASLIVLIPAMIFILRFKQFGAGLAAFCGYSFCIYLILAAILVWTPGIMAGGRLPWEILFSLFVGIAALDATAAAPLFIMRSAGYRLIWSRTSKPHY